MRVMSGEGLPALSVMRGEFLTITSWINTFGTAICFGMICWPAISKKPGEKGLLKENFTVCSSTAVT